MVALSTSVYSGCQKNVPLFERFFLQPLIPYFRISEFILEKRYKIFRSDRLAIRSPRFCPFADWTP